MRLLYIADEGFSLHNGTYYFTRPNQINVDQFGKYFSQVLYLARDGRYVEGSIPIPASSPVWLVGKTDFAGLRRLLREKRDEYDAALLRNGMNGCIAVDTLKRLGKPVISYLGYDALSYKFSQRTLRGYAEGIAWYFLERNKMAKGDYAHYCADYLAAKYPARAPYLVCPNVELTIDQERAQRRIRRILAGGGTRTVGMIATLNHNKGIDVAIRSIALLPEPFSLEFVGGGDPAPYRQLAETLGVADRVRFLGYFAERAMLEDWLETLDVYIQPSLSEGLPRSALEAMAMACPLIVSRTIGASGWIDPQWRIHPRDHRMLAEKIRQMCGDPKCMAEQAEKNFECAKQFQPELRQKKMDDYYRPFAAHSDPAPVETPDSGA